MSVAQPQSNKVVMSVTLAASVCLDGTTKMSGRMRLRLLEARRDRAVRGLDGHGDTEVGARVFAIDELDGAPVSRDELQDDRQADAGAFHGRALGGAAGIES